VNREFCVADGNGVVLRINGVDHRCGPGSITKFRGDDEVYATLIDGPMRALNLMVRDGESPIHLCRQDTEGLLAVIAIGEMQVFESDGLQFRLDVLDAVLTKSKRFPVDSVCDHLIFVA
jgi:environmental stress-induced protein Ves